MNYRLQSFHSALLRSGVGKKPTLIAQQTHHLKLSYARFVPMILLSGRQRPSIRWCPADYTPVGAIKTFILFAKVRTESEACNAQLQSPRAVKVITQRLQLPGNAPASHYLQFPAPLEKEKKQCQQRASEEVYLRRPHQCCANELCPGLQSSRPLKQYAI